MNSNDRVGEPSRSTVPRRNPGFAHDGSLPGARHQAGKAPGDASSHVPTQSPQSAGVRRAEYPLADSVIKPDVDGIEGQRLPPHRWRKRRRLAMVPRPDDRISALAGEAPTARATLIRFSSPVTARSSEIGLPQLWSSSPGRRRLSASRVTRVNCQRVGVESRGSLRHAVRHRRLSCILAIARRGRLPSQRSHEGKDQHPGHRRLQNSNDADPYLGGCPDIVPTLRQMLLD